MREKEKKTSPELQEPNKEAEVYNSNKKCDCEKKRRKQKKFKSLIRFHSSNKITNYHRAGKKGKKEREKSKRFYRTN